MLLKKKRLRGKWSKILMKENNLSDYKSFERIILDKLKNYSDKELDRMWEESDNNTSTDRTNDGIPKGLIWKEKTRRLVGAEAVLINKRVGVLPETAFVPDYLDQLRERMTAEEEDKDRKIG